VATVAGGHTCAAGLLNASPANQYLCDVHPSQSGQQLLASTVEQVVEANSP
jgi:lysophospholipase L1-like esterase